jgi:hypothetical protein
MTSGEPGFRHPLAGTSHGHYGDARPDRHGVGPYTVDCIRSGFVPGLGVVASLVAHKGTSYGMSTRGSTATTEDRGRSQDVRQLRFRVNRCVRAHADAHKEHPYGKYWQE